MSTEITEQNHAAAAPANGTLKPSVGQTSRLPLRAPRPSSPSAASPAADADSEAAGPDLAALRLSAALNAKRAEELEAQLAQTESTLAQTRQALDTAAQRRELDRLLIEADVIDLDAARLLAAQALQQDPSQAAHDPASIVVELREQRPYLFRRPPAIDGPGAMSAAAAPVSNGIRRIAEHAAATGDRSSLLVYLRARRSAGAA